MKKMATYMQILHIKQFIVHLNEINQLHKDKVYERNPSYKIYESCDQVEHKLTAWVVVISEARLIDNENFFACIDRTKHGKMGLNLIQLSSMMRKDVGNGTSGVPK